MKKTRISIIVVFLIIIGIAYALFSTEEKEENTQGYHVTLADPDLYVGGIFSDSFEISEGNYKFSFVPSGDSPQILTISIDGKSMSFSEVFQLEGTPHETGISVYYTWDYFGNKHVEIDETQEITLKINPHDNLLGPVSIDLVPVK